MIRKTGIYFLAAATVAYLYFMYNNTVISGILVFVLLFFPLSLLSLLAVRNCVSADMDRVPPLGETGRPVRTGITVTNKAKRGSVRCEVFVSASGLFLEKPVKKRFSLLLSAGQKKTLWFEFESGSCGNILLQAEKIRIYDFAGCFFISRILNRSAVVKMMPRMEYIPLEITKRTRDFQSESEEYSGERRGDDPSEIYQVREYREGDSVRDIHWKLSAREETLMIKERGFPLGCVVLVWVDLPESALSPEGIPAMLEKTASLSMTLAEEKCVHMVAWYEEKRERIVKCRVCDVESVYEMTWKLMDILPYRDGKRKRLCFDETFRPDGFSCILTVDAEGNIWKNGQKQEYLRL